MCLSKIYRIKNSNWLETIIYLKNCNYYLFRKIVKEGMLEVPKPARWLNPLWSHLRAPAPIWLNCRTCQVCWFRTYMYIWWMANGERNNFILWIKKSLKFCLPEPKSMICFSHLCVSIRVTAQSGFKGTVSLFWPRGPEIALTFLRNEFIDKLWNSKMWPIYQRRGEDFRLLFNVTRLLFKITRLLFND